MRIPYEKKKALVGVGFCVPWILGFLLLFLGPLVQSIYYAFQDMTITPGGFDVTFAGWDNFSRAIFSDSEFLQAFINTMKDMAYQVPTILIYSLFVALLLNQNFPGRMLVRGIFFLPVIIASGVILEILQADVMSEITLSGEKSSSMFQVQALINMLTEMGLGSDIISFISTTANSIFELPWRSGIQILLFIAGLQTVPLHLYEAATIDGCTAWEKFWKITFPLLTPVIMISLVFTITDHFTSATNSAMRIILDYSSNFELAYSSALSWMYFLVIIIVLGVLFALLGKKIVYV